MKVLKDIRKKKENYKNQKSKKLKVSVNQLSILIRESTSLPSSITPKPPIETPSDPENFTLKRWTFDDCNVSRFFLKNYTLIRRCSQ